MKLYAMKNYIGKYSYLKGIAHFGSEKNERGKEI